MGDTFSEPSGRYRYQLADWLPCNWSVGWLCLAWLARSRRPAERASWRAKFQIGQYANRRATAISWAHTRMRFVSWSLQLGLARLGSRLSGLLWFALVWFGWSGGLLLFRRRSAGRCAATLCAPPAYLTDSCSA